MGTRAGREWDVFLTRKTVIAILSPVMTCGEQLILGDSLPVTMHDFYPDQSPPLRRLTSSLLEDKLICFTSSSLGTLVALAADKRKRVSVLRVPVW